MLILTEFFINVSVLRYFPLLLLHMHVNAFIWKNSILQYIKHNKN